MKIDSVPCDRVLVLVPAGPRLDAAEALGFKAFLFDKADEGHRQMGVDLGQIEFIDSSGLGALVACLKRIGSSGSLCFCNPQESVQKIFKLCRMDRVLKVFDTREAMLTAMNA